MSLRLRVVLAIVSVLLLGSLAGVGLAGWQARRVLAEELAAAMTGARQTVASAFEDLPRSDHPDRDLRQLVATFDGNRHVHAAWIDARGAVRTASHPPLAGAAPGWFARLLAAEAHPALMPAPVSGRGSVILIPSGGSDIGALWTEFLDLSAVLAASLAAGAAVVWLTVGRALRPLADFSRAFARIGQGDYATTVREAGPVELNRLGGQVNDMARRLVAMQTVNNALEEQLRTLQDEERAELARDLHDEMGPHLFAAGVDAALARRLIGEGKPAEAAQQITAISASVAHLQALVRDILGRLRPAELIDLGLVAAIGELVAFWRARHPEIRFTVETPPDEEAVPAPLRETVYRIVQEGLNNAVRHARPGRVDVEVVVAGARELRVRVSDDGAGADLPGGAGYGLVGMRERVRAAGGVLRITRGDTGGWTLMASLPLAGSVVDRREAGPA